MGWEDEGDWGGGGGGFSGGMGGYGGGFGGLLNQQLGGNGWEQFMPGGGFGFGNQGPRPADFFDFGGGGGQWEDENWWNGEPFGPVRGEFGQIGRNDFAGREQGDIQSAFNRRADAARRNPNLALGNAGMGGGSGGYSPFGMGGRGGGMGGGRGGGGGGYGGGMGGGMGGGGNIGYGVGQTIPGGGGDIGGFNAAWSASQAEAKKANEQRYNDILAGYDKFSDQGMKDIQARADQGIGNMQQSAISRGLGNSTVTDSLARGINSDAEAARLRLGDQMLQNKLGFMERRTDSYPDARLNAGLAQGYGASGGAGGGIGGYGAGLGGINGTGVKESQANGFGGIFSSIQSVRDSAMGSIKANMGIWT